MPVARLPPYDVLHVLETAHLRGAAIARIVAGLADHLPREKYRLHACFLDNDGPLADELRSHDVQVSVANWSGGVRNPVGALRFARCLRSRPFSLVHLHTGGRSVSWLSKRIGGGKVIFHLHATVNESSPSQPILIHQADIAATIANSQATALAVNHARSTVIYPGIDFEPLRDRPRKMEPRIIGATGRLVPIKGLPLLIDAFALVSKRVPDVRLELAGTGPESLALEAQVKRLGLEERVEFLGWVDDPSTLYMRWEIFAQTSLAEGFGLSMLDAMAMGLPVVATSVGGIPELVVDGETGLLVTSREPAEFAGALEQLLGNAERTYSMGERGCDRARKEFSASVMAKRVEVLYDSLVETS